MQASVYRSIDWGSLYGSAPSALIPEAALDFNWKTGAQHAGTCSALRAARAGATAQVYLGGNVEANGANLIRLDSRAGRCWTSRRGSNPITITLTNLRAAYTGT